MSEYAMETVGRSKTLDKPITDEMIIYLFQEHLPHEIKRKIKPGLKDIGKFIRLLDSLQSTHQPNRANNDRQNVNRANNAQSNRGAIPKRREKSKRVKESVNDSRQVVRYDPSKLHFEENTRQRETCKTAIQIKQ